MANLLTKFKEVLQKDDFQIANRQYSYLNMSFNKGVGFTYDFNLADIPFLVQEIQLPNIQINNEGGVDIKTILGAYKSIGNIGIIPDSSNFTITFLDTQKGVFEYFFIPWLNHVITSKTRTGYTSNIDYPYTRCLLEVFFLKNAIEKGNISMISESDVSMVYQFDGVYPNRIDSPNVKYGPETTTTRTIGFEFNNTRVLVNINGRLEELT